MRIISGGSAKSPIQSRNEITDFIMNACRKAYSREPNIVFTQFDTAILEGINDASPAIIAGIAMIIEDISSQLAEFKAEPTITREDASNCIDAL